MNNKRIPLNIVNLNSKEQKLFKEAHSIIQGKKELGLHLECVERTMTIATLVIQFPSENEDYKVIKMLGIRIFNAFGASLKLLLSGYHQNSAMIMRDIMETIYLIDSFRGDVTAVERWRNADKKQRKKDFSPVKIRKNLDERDGFKNKKRAAAYEMLSELAVHPTMGTQYMIRSKIDDDMQTGPFMGETILRQGFEQLGILAVQAGEIMDTFLPKEYDVEDACKTSALTRQKWMETFYR